MRVSTDLPRLLFLLFSFAGKKRVQAENVFLFVLVLRLCDATHFKRRALTQEGGIHTTILLLSLLPLL